MECPVTDGRVAVAGGVVKERVGADAGVLPARRIEKRITTNGRVAVAGRVVTERRRPNGRVVLAAGVGKERVPTDGRVLAAGCVVKKGERAVGSIGSATRVA